jgi:hypothetical protein
LAHASSDLNGVTGMATLKTILAGERDRYKRADREPEIRSIQKRSQDLGLVATPFPRPSHEGIF